MTITSTEGMGEGGGARLYTASYLDDAGSPVALSLLPGFRPRYVAIENETDRILWEWRAGMAAAGFVKTVAAGTRTLETSGGATVTSAVGSQPSIAFAPAQNKQYRIMAQG